MGYRVGAHGCAPRPNAAQSNGAGISRDDPPVRPAEPGRATAWEHPPRSCGIRIPPKTGTTATAHTPGEFPAARPLAVSDIGRTGGIPPGALCYDRRRPHLPLPALHPYLGQRQPDAGQHVSPRETRTPPRYPPSGDAAAVVLAAGPHMAGSARKWLPEPRSMPYFVTQSGNVGRLTRYGTR